MGISDQVVLNQKDLQEILGTGLAKPVWDRHFDAF